MVKEELQLDLPHLLVDGTISFLLGLAGKALLADDLEGCHETGLAMPGYMHIYLTRCTSPKRPFPSFLTSWNSCRREGCVQKAALGLWHCVELVSRSFGKGCSNCRVVGLRSLLSSSLSFYWIDF
jgi:hypothetical protein